MSDITAITPQVKDKERCNIYVDGKFYCGLKLETALRYRLKAGEPIECVPSSVWVSDPPVTRSPVRRANASKYSVSLSVCVV